MALKRALKPIFSKKIIGFLIFLVQILFIITTIDKLNPISGYLYHCATFLSIIAILFEINRDVSPDFKIIWIALFAVFPLFGMFLYIYVHMDLLNFGIRRVFNDINNRTKDYVKEMNQVNIEISEKEPDEAGIFNYLYNEANAPCFSNCDVTYFKLGEDMFKQLLKDIEAAKDFIFLEFFIINEHSHMWHALEKILIEKAKSGVDVRVVYDGLGSISTANTDFDKQLSGKGIKCKIFSPVKPFISSYHNNRDHRKIVVIDGKIAYTGGINLADEYINKKVRFGHWKDTAVRIYGEGANSFSILFLKIWALLTKNKTSFDNFMRPLRENIENEGYFAAFDDNPLDNERVSENVYLHMINTSKKYVYINTPYLILDDETASALKFAAKRGVDVRITMPHIPDKWYAFALGRTYYPELIKAGVKIYEYTPGFVHAKSTVSDDVRAFIGSVNYDFRSLYLHYECGLYIYKNNVIKSIYDDYNETIEKCHLFTLEDYKNLKLLYRFVGRIFRFFAPLM